MRDFYSSYFFRAISATFALSLLILFNVHASNNNSNSPKIGAIETIACTSPPTIICPPNYQGCPGDDTSTASLGFAIAQAGSADCDPPIVGSYDIILTNGPCSGEIYFKRVWYAYDPNDPSLMVDCIQSITLIDDDAPIIHNCPHDIIAVPTESDCGAIVTWTEPTASDICSTTTLSSNFSSGDTFADGTTTTIIYTATDLCGNIETCSFTVSVAGSCCYDPPNLTCPIPFSGCPLASTDPINTGFAIGTPGSNNCLPPIINYNDIHISNGPCTGATLIERTWTATDPENPTSQTSCIQYITLEDNIDPILSNCPNNITVQSTDGICAIASWTTPSATDNCTLGNISSNFNSGECFPIGNTIINYTAIDNCGNSATCSFTVIVEDLSCQMAPNLTCPSNYSGCPGESTNPDNTGNPVALPGGPNCGNPSVSYIDNVISSGPCNGAIVIERTWTAIDPDDNSLISSCLQMISLIDTTNPVISNCPNTINLNSNDGNCVSATWTIPNANDNCGISNLTSTLQSGHCFDIGTTVVSYTAIDNCGNSSTCSFQVIVEDLSCMNGPTLICPPDFTECPGDNNANPKLTGLPIAFASGPNCGNAIVSFSDNLISNSNCGELIIERTWTAIDENDNSLFSSCVQMISFVDDVDPILSQCPGNQILSSLDGNCMATNWTPPTATDICGTAILTSNYDSNYCFPIGSTTVIYTATDECGNTATCDFQIEVIDNSCINPPSISCPSDFNACPSSSIEPDITGWATATSGGMNCGEPVISYSDNASNPYSCNIATHIIRTWTATDPDNSNLSSSCTQIIILNDLIDPTISCPNNISLSSTDGNCVVANWPIPNTNDHCTIVSVTSDFDTGDCFPVGTTQVNYYVTDGCGNTSSCSFNIEVIDNSCTVAPAITCPIDFNGCLNASIDPSATGLANAISGGPNCGSPIISYVDEISHPFPCSNATQIIRTWTATDEDDQNLYSSCEQIIIRNDEIAPSISCPSDISIMSENGNSGAIVTWINPLATDNCGIASTHSNFQSGDFFSVGITTITYTVEDHCGNTSTCSFQIEVVPNFEINCPDDISVECDGSYGTIVSWDIPSWTGACNVDCSGGETIDGFVYMGTLNGNHYYCSLLPDTWFNAQTNCEANGGYLATIESEEENAFIAAFLNTQSAYIGASDYNNEGNFTWSDGTALTYSNWYPGQPNNFNGAQHFVEMLSNGQWNDQYAKVSLEYVMEIPCNNVIQTSGPINGSQIPTGNHEVCYEIADDCANIASCCFTITVESSISIDCPDDPVFNLTNGQNGVIVNWETPNVTSCCSAIDCHQGGQINGFIYMGSFNGSHYYCSALPATWSIAQSNCVANGGNLAIINDAYENAFVANFLTNQSAYIGCSDHLSEGNFTWVDGSTLSYSNWYPGQPNNFNASQHYVEMLSDGTWNDQYEKTALEYVMEIPACNSIQQIAGPPSGSLFGPNTTTTISYEAYDACGNSTTCSFNISINASYCSSGGTNSKYVFIDQCGFGPINNTSGNNGGYGDFSNTCYDVTQGQNCPINLSPGFGASKYLCYWKIYCDWNQDYDFFDAGELIGYGAGTGNISGNYTIPANVTGACRLRVVMKYGAYPTGPCEIFPHGETEDYCINVLANPSISNGVSYREENDAINFGEDIPISIVRIEDFSRSNLEVSVYPNPANDLANIDIETKSTEPINIFIYDSAGRLMLELNEYEQDKNSMINVSGWKAGIYFIKVNNGNEVITKRLLVSN